MPKEKKDISNKKNINLKISLVIIFLFLFFAVILFIGRKNNENKGFIDTITDTLGITNNNNNKITNEEINSHSFKEKKYDEIVKIMDKMENKSK